MLLKVITDTYGVVDRNLESLIVSNDLRVFHHVMMSNYTYTGLLVSRILWISELISKSEDDKSGKRNGCCKRFYDRAKY